MVIFRDVKEKRLRREIAHGRSWCAHTPVAR